MFRLKRLEAARKTTHSVTSTLTRDPDPGHLSPGLGPGGGVELDHVPGHDVVFDPFVNVGSVLGGPPPHSSKALCLETVCRKPGSCSCSLLLNHRLYKQNSGVSPLEEVHNMEGET